MDRKVTPDNVQASTNRKDSTIEQSELSLVWTSTPDDSDEPSILKISFDDEIPVKYFDVTINADGPVRTLTVANDDAPEDNVVSMPAREFCKESWPIFHLYKCPKHVYHQYFAV